MHDTYSMASIADNGTTECPAALATSTTPLAKMAHSAVSLRNSSRGRAKEGTTSVAISNWDEHKARSVDTWASGLRREDLPDEADNRGIRTMRFGLPALNGRLGASVGDSRHRDNNTGVKRGRQEAAGLEHPNLHLWSCTAVSDRHQGKENGSSSRQSQSEATNPPPRGLPNTIPSRFANSLSASSQRRDISKSSSTRSSVPVVVVPYQPRQPRLSAPSSNASRTSGFSFSSLANSAPRIPKSIYKMRSSGPPPSLPPVSEFDIQNILEWAKNDDEETGERGVKEDLERIAEICARSRLSLANQYERHMPPHGVGHDFWKEDIAGGEGRAQGSGGVGGGRRARKGRSKAFETLETIYASSSSGQSSKDGKGRRKSAKELVEEVRQRNAKDKKTEEEMREREGVEDADHERSVIEGTGGRRNSHIRREGLIIGSRHAHVGRDGKRRKRLAAVFIDTASTAGSQSSAKRLTSKPLKPRTSNVKMEVGTVVEAVALHEQIHNTEHITSHTPHIPLLAPELPLATMPILHDSSPTAQEAPSQSVLGTFSTWLPWLRQPTASVEAIPAEALTETYFEVLPSAEGSLKRLLDAGERGKKRNGERGREAG